VCGVWLGSAASHDCCSHPHPHPTKQNNNRTREREREREQLPCPALPFLSPSLVNQFLTTQQNHRRTACSELGVELRRRRRIENKTVCSSLWVVSSGSGRRPLAPDEEAVCCIAIASGDLEEAVNGPEEGP